MELIRDIEEQFIELMLIRGFNRDEIYFDHSTPRFISVNYCCRHLFIIHCCLFNNPIEWEQYKLDLLNSVSSDDKCEHQQNNQKIQQQIIDSDDDILSMSTISSTPDSDEPNGLDELSLDTIESSTTSDEF